MTSLGAKCAVWHPFLTAIDIIEAVGLEAEVQWSAKDVHPKSGGVRDRTYCRFDLGRISQATLSDGFPALAAFDSLKLIPGFCDGGAVTLYLKNILDGPEVFINIKLIRKLCQLHADIVFR
jgi:hypothetical protein